MPDEIIPINERGVDFIAILRYATTGEGGRKTPVFKMDDWLKCYRPQVKFHFSEKQTSGSQKFIDKDVVHPGDTVTAEIILLGTEIFKKKLKEGMDFDFREGSQVMGTGRIIRIINEQLRV